MKTFWNILPLALPLLVLVAVLTSCGKSNKITGNVFNLTPKDTVKGTSAEHANNGANPSNVTENPAFRDGCQQQHGVLELAAGNLCVIQVTKKNLDPANVGDQEILADYHEGDLIVSTVTAGDIPAADADIRLGGEHLMSFGDRAMPIVNSANKTARLSMLLLGQVTGVATVSVWTCLDINLKHTSCNTNVFRQR